jgi:tight adherence protein C
MELIAAGVLFLFLMGVVSYVGYRSYARPGQIYDQVGTSASSADYEVFNEIGEEQQQAGRTVRMLERVGEALPADIEDISSIRWYLIAAGYRSKSAPAKFTGIRLILTVFMVLAAIVVRSFAIENVMAGVVFVLAMGLIGYFGPTFYLEYMVSKRQELIKFGLPDALDLLVVAVEAGMGLDQAMQVVSRELRHTHRDIADEFGLVNLEMRAGESRAGALRHLAERTGEPGVRQLVGILIQADRFGTSTAEALRTHSDFMRIKRRQEAEERANKVGVKLVFPIFFFILPAMLVVAAGSGILQVVKYLFPLMQSAGRDGGF